MKSIRVKCGFPSGKPSFSAEIWTWKQFWSKIDGDHRKRHRVARYNFYQIKYKCKTILFLEEESPKKEKEGSKSPVKETPSSSASVPNSTEINHPHPSEQKIIPLINVPVTEPEPACNSQMDVDIASNGTLQLADVKQETAQSSQEAEVDLDSMTLDERLRFMQQRDHEAGF